MWFYLGLTNVSVDLKDVLSALLVTARMTDRSDFKKLRQATRIVVQQ